MRHSILSDLMYLKLNDRPRVSVNEEPCLDGRSVEFSHTFSPCSEIVASGLWEGAGWKVNPPHFSWVNFEQLFPHLMQRPLSSLTSFFI